MRGFGWLSVLSSVLLAAPPVAGQTLFTWPDTAVDVSQYATVEECHAAVERVTESVRRNEFFLHRVWRDTLPYDPVEDVKPIPAEAQEAARSCGARFSDVEAQPVSEYRMLVPLYLAAGWDEKARALVKRRMDAAAREGEAALAAALDTVVHVYSGRTGGGRSSLPGFPGLSVQPPRFDLVTEVVDEYLPRVSDRMRRVKILMAQVQLARFGARLLDSARIEWAAPQILALVDSLSEAEKAQLAEELTGFTEDKDELEKRLYRDVYRAVESASKRQALLDSLRHSTAAYVREYRRQHPRAVDVPYGQPAPTLEGDVWLGCGDRCASRPVPGRVSLVVFFYHDVVRERPNDQHQCISVVSGASGIRAHCPRLVYTLRRLADRFPELDITIVARTHGFFGYLKEDMTAEKEAELLRRWLESFGVRAVISMTETDYWRLPNHDRRRIDEPTTNEVNYSFDGPAGPRPNGWSVLIDEDGLIVYDTVLQPDSRSFAYESQLIEMIEALLERNAARR